MPNVYAFKDFEGSSHRILIRQIRRHCRSGGTLLDVGAAGGELGHGVRSIFDRTIAIEGDVNRISDLRSRFDLVVIGDLERFDQLPRELEAVVLADIIEHLREPKRILDQVRAALTPEGVLFVSVPNIANITIRLGLLFGFFIYRDRGILDASHLRFYTLSTIRKELADAGFTIVSIHGSAIPIRLVLGKAAPEGLLRPVEWLIARVTQVWKALLGYQIIVVARRR